MAARPSKTTKTAKPALAAVPTEVGPAAPKAASAANAAPAAAKKAAKIAIVAQDDDGESAGGKADTLKMKELLAAVVTQSGAKKKDAKDVLDAALAEIAEALSKGKSLSLPPLGNIRVAKTTDKDGVKMMVLRLRMGGGKGGKEGLAEDGEDS